WRILLVPLIVWLLVSQSYFIGFLVFIAAGISDGIDGFVARRFNMRTELGGFLDPIADKALLVSVYVTLGLLKEIPAWLVILVVSRDVIIVGAVVLSFVVAKPLVMRPLLVSKANTAAQVALAAGVLANLGLGLDVTSAISFGLLVVALLTVASAALYMR